MAVAVEMSFKGATLAQYEQVKPAAGRLLAWRRGAARPSHGAPDLSPRGTIRHSSVVR